LIKNIILKKLFWDDNHWQNGLFNRLLYK